MGAGRAPNPAGQGAACRGAEKSEPRICPSSKPRQPGDLRLPRSEQLSAARGSESIVTRSSRIGPPLRIAGLAALLALGWAPAAPRTASGEQVVLQDGRVLEGILGSVGGLAENPGGSSGGEVPATKTIELINNNLTRTFVPHSRVQRREPDKPQLALQKITIKQQVGPPNVDRIGLIGNMSVEPFDDFGRRIVKLAGPKGEIRVIQGITEITPVYTRVQGLAGMHPYYWDMRIATSSIPRKTLFRILANTKVIDPKKIDDRTKLVRLLLDSERYGEAESELATIVRDFPGQDGLEKEVRAIRQLQARQVIGEINLRRNAGQFALAYALLENFPREQIAGETLQQVAAMLDQYAEMQKHGKELLEGIEKNLIALKDDKFQKQAQAAVDEIKQQLNFNTLDSLADYSQQAGNAQMTDDQKLSLAISGWLLGANHATPNLAVATSLFEVRDLVRQYLSEGNKNKRKDLLAKLSKTESNSCEMVALLLDHMTPAIEVPSPSEGTPGFYEFEVSAHSADEPAIGYYLQLPPEYDPHRRYPLVITLRGAGTTALQQLDWWTGSADDKGNRMGQAMRHGYIVMAVEWARPEQQQYEYTAREHATVLASLRHACRRFSIDTDRVFLSGHSMGGTAAWDLAVFPSRPVGRRDSDRARRRPLLPALQRQRRAAPLLCRRGGAGRIAEQGTVEGHHDGSRPLSEEPLRRHRGAVPGARARTFLRRNPAHLRLDGPAETRFLPQDHLLCHDAPLGLFVLVAGAGQPAQKRHRRPARLAAQTGLSAGPRRRLDQGQDDLHPHRRRPGDRLAQPRAGRFL